MIQVADLPPLTPQEMEAALRWEIAELEERRRRFVAEHLGKIDPAFQQAEFQDAVFELALLNARLLQDAEMLRDLSPRGRDRRNAA